MTELQTKVSQLIDHWLIGCILKKDIAQMLDPPTGGNYAVGTVLFVVIDFLGGLLNGNVETGHTKNMVAFLTQYLARRDPRYGEISDLLVDMFRHPLVHESGSRSYHLRTSGYLLGSSIGWRTGGRSTLDRDRQCHLVRKLYRGHDWIVINDHVLYLDIREALDDYRTELLSGSYPGLVAAFEKAYDQIGWPIDVEAMATHRHKTKRDLAPKLKAQIEKVKLWTLGPDKCFADE